MNCKRILGIALLAIALAPSATTAQNIVDNYSFSTTIDSTAWIAGVNSAIIASPTGTVTSIRSDRIDIGFTFNLGGSTFTQFSTNVNGAIRLGSSLISSGDFAQPLGRNCYAGRVEPFGWRGQFDSTCYTRYATVGDSGSRVTVVETRMGVYGQDSTHVTFQVQLFEATGSIRFVYGPIEGPLPQMTRQCGVARTTSDIIFIEQENHEAFRFETSCTQTTAADVWPETWRCYTMEPDASPCPYPGEITVVNNDPANITLTGNSGEDDLHILIPAMGIDTIWPATESQLTLSTVFNPASTYNGTAQTICAGGRTSHRTRAFSFTTACGTVHLLPWSDDFQAAATAGCWLTPYLSSSYSWQRQSSNGNYYMRTGYSSGWGLSAPVSYNEWLISPLVALPDTVGLTLGWWYKSENLDNVAPKVRVRLLVCDTTDAADTAAAWVTLDVINDYEQNFQQHRLSLDAYAGHRVRVAFQHYGDLDGKYAYVDNVSIEVRMQPTVGLEAPARAYAGDTTAVLAPLLLGVLSNPQYEWYSSMQDHGQGVFVSASNDTLRMVYLADGMDTVTVTLTTDYGTATQTAVIEVVDCQPVTVFPWQEGFEHGLDCWMQTGNSSWTLCNYYKHSGEYCIRSNTDRHSNLIVSQPVAVPADAFMLRLGFWGKLNSGNGDATSTITVRIGNESTTDWAKATVLGTATVGVRYTWVDFPLDAYAGQTVRFALHHTQSSKVVHVDDIAIRYTREPVISLAVSSSQVYVGDTVTATATLTEGDTAGIVWWLNSRMADMGQADITGSGPQVQIAYHGTGIDTIVASATNAYGSFTDTAYVRVCPVPSYANEPVVQAEADDGYFPGTPVNLTASLLEGDTMNLTYSWASTMTQRGDATLTFDGGPQAILVPSMGGPDTVTVWATNNHGTDSTTIVVNIKPCATVDSLPWVEDFSNRFTCWWQPARSQWSPDNTGIMACVINSPMPGDNWLISRAIELPTLPSVEGEGTQLWWDAAAIFANSHTYSVWITTGDYRDTGSYEPLATYSSTLPTFNSGWSTPRVDLSAYAGQTMHLAFRYQTHFYNISSFPGILAIDNVRILDTRPPQVAIIPPARCFADDTVVYRANLIHGVQSGMSYTWQSAMEQQELADVYFDDSLIYVVYHAAGSDTVSLVASNAYGSDTAWTTMTVKNCPAVTVPWYEDFEVVNPCWSGAWTPDHITYTWLDSTTHVMHSSPNSWYASPWIDLPDTTGLQLMWNKNGSAANSFMKIFVSPTGSIEPADFTDTLLYGETPNGFDSVSLDAYAGRRIRVAFAQRASSNYSDSYSLDDVRVDYNRTAPQVSLVAPLFASSFGDAITATATLGNIAPGVTYCWSSTFGVVTAMGAQCHIGYTVAGEDTITVVASNPYGSDTALAVVTVYDCGGMTTVPFFEDFSNITTTTYRVRGWLPPCWNATWTGDTPGPAPHVITTDGYQWLGNIPDNALLMQAGTSTGYGPLAEVVLPRFADSLHHLMMAFDYRFESAYYGTLVVGYYDDTVFTAVDTLARHADNYRRDTVLFAMHFFANNPHIAIRWQHSGGSWFAVAIDNLEVYSIADSTEGINELSIFNSQFSIYPNPASMTVTVETDQPSTLTMTDAIGRECGRWKVGNGKTTLDIRPLPAGVYFVRLSTSPTIRKLIIR